MLPRFDFEIICVLQILLQNRRSRIQTPEQGALVVQRAWRARAARVQARKDDDSSESGKIDIEDYHVDNSIDSPLYHYDQVLSTKKVWWGG